MVLQDLPDADLNFSKVKEWRIEMWWDDLPVWLDENSTYNYTIIAKNVGSENGTFDIFAEVPTDWTWDADVTNITLNLSQTTSFSFELRVNTSEEVLAVPQSVLVKAAPREGDSEDSELELVININQHYGFELRETERQRGDYRMGTDKEGNPQRQATYFFALKNLGNGNDTIRFTVSDITDWEIDLPETQIKLLGYEERPSVPIEVALPDEEEMRPQILRITGTSDSGPDTQTDTIDLELSFPDLVAHKRDVTGDDDGEPLEWPENEAPAFTFLMAMAAIGLVALAADRRRRGW
ncbi:MAG: hypothetical protein GWN89_12775 [Thermoplasmata archaeon]|nr:hypothetical protein [Thermoplasmata archaeon]